MKPSAPSYHKNMSEEPPSGNAPVHDVDSSVAEIIVSAPRAAARARWAETVFLVALAVYAALAVLAHRYAYFDWDLSLALSLQSISIRGFEGAMIGVSLLGTGWVAWPLVIVTGIVLINKGLRSEGVICMAGTGSGWLVNQLLKVSIGRPRPSDALVNVDGTFHFKSFPSGHVVFFVEFFGFLLFLALVLLKRGALRNASLIMFGLLIALVGVSRVYLGAHWPSDVLGAYLAGGIWLMLMIEVYRRRIKGRLRDG
jgi:membrane-associated phospholipid phosphatase